MNNKGQTLVVFVLILPIILILLIGIIDIGSVSIEKRKINNVLDNAIEYYKNGKNVDKYLNKNFDNYNIYEDNGNIKIKVNKSVNGIMKNYDIEITKEG